MDEKTKELIAVGVSVGVHCQPCLEYHVNKARELGNSDGEIREAIEVGHQVEKGAAAAIQKLESKLLAPTCQAGSCCTTSKASCCS